MDTRAQSFFSCLKNLSFEFFKKKQEAHFFPRIYLWGNKRCHYLISTSWYLEESPLCSSKKSLTISTRKERKKGGGGGGLEEKSKSLRVNQKALLCRRKFLREKKGSQNVVLCVFLLSSFSFRWGKRKFLVLSVYYIGKETCLLTPPKSHCFPKTRIWDGFFIFISMPRAKEKNHRK